MKLEHRSQKIIPIHLFLYRVLKYTLFATFLIVFSVGIGVIGYKHFANLNLIDSFHMSCLILTGMGPVVEMKTDQAKIFSSLYALYSGVAFLSITAVFFSPIIHRLLHILQIDNDES
jgi:hypothetical protein